MNGEKFKKAFISLVEKYEDPLAPIKIQEAHKWVVTLGSMVTRKDTKPKVDEIQALLLKHIPEDKLEELCAEPEWICAVCAILITSIETHVKRLVR